MLEQLPTSNYQQYQRVGSISQTPGNAPTAGIGQTASNGQTVGNVQAAGNEQTSRDGQRADSLYPAPQEQVSLENTILVTKSSSFEDLDKKVSKIENQLTLLNSLPSNADIIGRKKWVSLLELVGNKVSSTHTSVDILYSTYFQNDFVFEPVPILHNSMLIIYL